MINKNNLWFLTLFSLILILGVYYVTLPSDVLDKIKIKDKVEEPVVKEENPLVALRVSLEETRKTSKEKQSLVSIILQQYSYTQKPSFSHERL